MDVKMNFRVITKNHAADSKIESSHKINFRAVGTQESYPTTWELMMDPRPYFMHHIFLSVFYLFITTRGQAGAGGLNLVT